MTKLTQQLKLWAWILLLCGLLRGLFFYLNINAPLQLEESLVYQVRAGQSLTHVLEELGEREVLRAPFDLRMYARFSGLAGSIKAGEYVLNADMNGRELLDKMVRGEVHYRRLVLPEGWTAAQALQSIQSNPYIKVTLKDSSLQSLQRALGLEVHPEGQFFPDTYSFTRGTSDLEILRRAHALMQQVLAEEWDKRAQDLPYDSPYEALIMASIVEKETAVAQERGQIAGVFVRRLRQGMRLQTDPTVIYGLGQAFDGNLTRAHLRAKTPYNTYRINGLPPTPIALPGRGAIAASLNPTPGDALYFVSRGDGTHVFSTTLEQHNAAVREFQINSTEQSSE